MNSENIKRVVYLESHITNSLSNTLSDIKQIRLPDPGSNPKKKDLEKDKDKDKDKDKEKSEKILQKKIITQTDKWIFEPLDLEYNNQKQYIDNIYEKNNIHATILSFIQAKRSGYKSQDVNKAMYDPTRFVSLDYLIGLLQESKLLCFYCKEPVKIIYEYSRDPKQWSLERIENDQGHNMGNVSIACLECNLRRRTMYHERYVMTKQMAKIVKI